MPYLKYLFWKEIFFHTNYCCNCLWALSKLRLSKLRSWFTVFVWKNFQLNQKFIEISRLEIIIDQEFRWLDLGLIQCSFHWHMKKCLPNFQLEVEISGHCICHKVRAYVWNFFRILKILIFGIHLVPGDLLGGIQKLRR